MVIELLHNMGVFNDKDNEDEKQVIKGWFADTISSKEDEAYPNISLLWEALLQRISDNTGWFINNKQREIVPSHYNEIIFYLKKELNEELQRRPGSVILPRGHLQRYPAYIKVQKQLAIKSHSKKQEQGKEASSRRDLQIYDHEQIELFNSLLRHDVEDSSVIDTLTLGVITSGYLAIGKRGMSIDSILQGYISITRWNHQVWEFITPIVLQLKVARKGDGINATPHIEQLFHHRNPTRDTTSWIGHYFAYQFCVLNEELPTVDRWMESMHQRPLIRTQQGNKANVTDFNPLLKKYLIAIGADDNITFHVFRNTIISEAGEVGISPDAIEKQVGHNGCHNTNYLSKNRAMGLNGAGYSPDPEPISPWAKALHEDIAKENDSLLMQCVGHIFDEYVPKWKSFEQSAKLDTTDAGERMRTWIHFVKTSISTWIASCAGTLRNRFNYIDDITSVTRAELTSPDLLGCLITVFKLKAYTDFRDIVSAYETEELELGKLAQLGPGARTVGLMIGALDKKMDHIQSSTSDESKEECEKNKDLVYFQQRSLNDSPMAKRLKPSDPEVRQLRLKDEVRRVNDESRFQQTLLLSPRAGLVSNANIVKSCTSNHDSNPKSSRFTEGNVDDGKTRNMEVDSLALINNSGSQVLPSITSSITYSNSKLETSCSIEADFWELDNIMGGIPQLLRIFVINIAPMERMGKAWRSKETIGEKKGQQIADALSGKFYRILFQVCKLSIDNDESLMDSAIKLESTRKGQWKAFIATLPSMRSYDSSTKIMYHQKLVFGTHDLVPSSDKLPKANTPSNISISSHDSTIVTSTNSSKPDSTCFVGIDPGMYTGWSMFHVNSSVIESIDVGIIKVDSSMECIGHRGLDIQRRLLPLLNLKPRMVFIEKFFGKGRDSDSVSYGMQTAIKMALVEHGIEYKEICPQTWKCKVEGHGNAEKAQVTNALIEMFGPMPKRLSLDGKSTMSFFHKDRHASDAMAICYCGISNELPLVSFTKPVSIRAPIV